MFFEDGVEFVKKGDHYDLIIVDSTDPIGPRRGTLHNRLLFGLLQGFEQQRYSGKPALKAFYEKEAEMMKSAHRKLKNTLNLQWCTSSTCPPTPRAYGCSDSQARAAPCP